MQESISRSVHASHLGSPQTEKIIQRRPKDFGGYNSTASRFRRRRGRLGILWRIHQDDEDESERSAGVSQKFPIDLVAQYT